VEFKRQSLLANGFQGFISFKELRSGKISEVPRSAGVYVVLREFDSTPIFLDANPAGRFRGRNPTVSKSKILSNWVEGAHVIYIGKGGELQRRIKQFIDFGAGKPIGHWGGRLVWQIQNSADFLVAWKRASNGQDAATLESEFLMEFNSTYRRLPFANLKK
jgi:hypothetical protein